MISVPFRSLIPKNSARITVAALAVRKGIPSREIDARDIVSLTVEHGAVSI